MNNDNIIIRQLIKRFMDGTTTVDEEKRIAHWFKEHPKTDADLELYRKMFEWFDNGMPTNESRNAYAGESTEDAKKHSHNPKKHLRLWLYAASIAIIAVVSATLLFHKRQPVVMPKAKTELAAVMAKPTNSNIKRNGVKTNTVYSHGMKAKRTKPVRSSVNQNKQSTATTTPILAAYDSMVIESERMVYDELAKIEAEQREILRQLNNNIAIDELIFTATLQDYNAHDVISDDAVY